MILFKVLALPRNYTLLSLIMNLSFTINLNITLNTCFIFNFPLIPPSLFLLLWFVPFPPSPFHPLFPPFLPFLLPSILSFLPSIPSIFSFLPSILSFLPSFLSFLPSILPFLPSSLPSLLSFLPSFLPSSLPSSLSSPSPLPPFCLFLLCFSFLPLSLVLQHPPRSLLLFCPSLFLSLLLLHSLAPSPVFALVFRILFYYYLLSSYF